MVAVKRYLLSSYALEGFRNEIFLGSGLNYRNVMNLLGYCIHENGEAILVYNYMEHGTLYDHLHKVENTPLTWKQRLEICIDAAKGLDYLHTGSDNLIIHRDVKTAKILLNKKWMAKLSNFSESKAWPSGERDINFSTDVRGTIGYLDPEYVQTSQLTEKSDVYSYGVVLFEVLCGKPAIDHSSEAEQTSLAIRATLYFKDGKLEEIIDSNLNGQIAPECLRAFSEITAACLNSKGEDRPAIRDVVLNLELAMQLQEAVAVNVTLHNHLHDTENPPLTWKQRLQICLGAAKGLDYLHAGAQHVVIHHDVRTTNILLDEKWVAKVYDLALSQVLRSDRDQTHVNRDPGYNMSMHLTVKSDVYSYGVLLFEVLSQCLKKFVETAIACLSFRGIDRPTMRDVVGSLESAMQLQEAAAIDEGNRMVFAAFFHISSFYTSLNMNLVDESLGGEFSKGEALRCIQVGLLCSQHEQQQRPTMASALKMLLGEDISPERCRHINKFGS